MQTSFSLAQLADPQTAESERILRTCVHCGFCTATCPTYVLLGDELDSPRGRIYLIKEMLEQARPATADVVKHIDRCLSCLACMTTCPSGVHYMHLVDHARVHIERTYARPWGDRWIRALLAHVLPYRTRFRAALRLAAFARRVLAIGSVAAPRNRPPDAETRRGARAPGSTGLAGRLRAMLELAPLRLPERSSHERPAVHRAQGRRRGRVALMLGCANEVLAPAINAAAIRLLTRHGIEVVVAAGEGCCGALVHHMGREHQALALARRAIDAWTREIEGEGLDAILVTASGCGTTVKDYGFMLRTDPAYAAKAARVSALAQDISEYLAARDIAPAAPARGLVVAYHAACSLQHGQRIVREPKHLLMRAGFTVRDIPEGHLCCGSAGTYNMLQPEIAGRLRERKVANIERIAPDVIATGNIGCMVQIGQATSIPIVHTVELLDWSDGGPAPVALEHIARRANSPQRSTTPAS
ncbi:MAG: 4Fe-4S dicluster domain-containing protein [Variibacter sp.]|nr:4Fe-4S dicluster domain-containing protein [Variibacter sp.]